MFLPGRDVAGTSDPTISAGSYEYSNSPELKALIAAANDNGRFDEGTASDVTSMLLTVIASSTTISFLSSSYLPAFDPPSALTSRCLSRD